ncbi:putative multicopper oxidase, type 1 [Acrodontium crateriforme]|uniref:Multicopper oxidase, type 1 n=1 Tax=Acrodontium crateriforme TaxID=150365 RepID=A0AAQ3MC74_9PEZI|nr:putative multicopper oxidase, type 1 [Acrodontium crateriforme]
MRRRLEDDELQHELVEHLGGSSMTLNHVGPEQELLGDWRHGSDDTDAKSSLKKWGPVVWVAMSGALIISLILSTLLILALGDMLGAAIHSPPHEVDKTATVPETNFPDQRPEIEEIKRNDYILDPEWDFQAPPQRREYTWTLRDQEYNPDGVYRPMILVENQYPGPLIECNDGDTIIVHVKNHAINATSIHWHGLFQTGTPHMDGAVGITQCPIAPGGSFTYEFTVAGQSGTYWWHAHQGATSSDGVHGPFIIHSKHEKSLQLIDYVSDRVLLVSDHYHDLSSALLWQYLAPDMENAEPVPQGGLINGRGSANCDDYPERKCDKNHSGLSAMNLTPSENHRIRIINVGAFAEFQVQIDEHQLAVTEVDGTDVNPISYHRINITPAQRYSVIVKTNITSADSFWLRARMLKGCFTDSPKTLQTDVMSVVYYSKGESQSGKEPTSKDWENTIPLECRDLNTTELTPVEVIQAPAQADAFFYLRTNFEIGAYRLSRGFFNSSTWRPNAKSPTLLRAVDGLSTSNASFSPPKVSISGTPDAFVNNAAFDLSRELVIQTSHNKTIDILLSNFDDGNHPLHLHGYKFFILAQGHGYPPRKSPLQGMTQENLQPLFQDLDLTNPLRRDTASVEAFGWILLRFVADNPGMWAFHCHVAWHVEAGFMMQFLTGADELAGLVVPETSRELCRAEGIEKGMAPEDEVYYDLAR